MLKYETTAVFGPLGECPTSVYYNYTPADNTEEAGKVQVLGGEFYTSHSKDVYFDQEAASNLREDLTIEEEIREWHEAQPDYAEENHAERNQ